MLSNRLCRWANHDVGSWEAGRTIGRGEFGERRPIGTGGKRLYKDLPAATTVQNEAAIWDLTFFHELREAMDTGIRNGSLIERALHQQYIATPVAG